MDLLKQAMLTSRSKLTSSSPSAASTTTNGVKRFANGNESAAAAAASAPSAAPPGPKRFKTRGEILAEQAAAAAAAKTANTHNHHHRAQTQSPESTTTTTTTTTTSADAGAPDVDDLEMRKRLRAMGEPICLFGETAKQRLSRLHDRELHAHERQASSAGRSNTFHEIMQSEVENELKQVLLTEIECEKSSRQDKSHGSSEEADHEHGGKKNNGGGGGGGGGAGESFDPYAIDSSLIDDIERQLDAEDAERGGASAGSSSSSSAAASAATTTSSPSTSAPASKRTHKPRTDYRGVTLSRADFASDGDFVLYFFKRMLSEWENELELRPADVKRSLAGRVASATQKQTRQFLKPLFKLLKAHACHADILRHATTIASSCLTGNYIAANEAYLTMAIGNAAWPMGVTMVGIHERSGREKISSSQVAHVLNDETQRKYIQSMKRVMTWCQDHYPATVV